MGGTGVAKAVSHGLDVCSDPSASSHRRAAPVAHARGRHGVPRARAGPAAGERTGTQRHRSGAASLPHRHPLGSSHRGGASHRPCKVPIVWRCGEHCEQKCVFLCVASTERSMAHASQLQSNPRASRTGCTAPLKRRRCWRGTAGSCWSRGPAASTRRARDIWTRSGL